MELVPDDFSSEDKRGALYHLYLLDQDLEQRACHHLQMKRRGRVLCRSLIVSLAGAAADLTMEGSRFETLSPLAEITMRAGLVASAVTAACAIVSHIRYERRTYPSGN